jgi:hypothetical protein
MRRFRRFSGAACADGCFVIHGRTSTLESQQGMPVCICDRNGVKAYGASATICTVIGEPWEQIAGR